MPNRKQLVVGLVILVAGFLVWLVVPSNSDGKHTNGDQAGYAVGRNYCLQLDIADTPVKKQRGLSGRDRLEPSEGMLFLYERSGRYGFWMKDMSFPIDIIWLDEDNRIVTIKRRAQPDSYPQTFKPDQPAKKIIETPAGWTQKQNTNSGDQLTLVGPTTTTPVGCGSD